MEVKNIILTDHAKDRAKEYEISDDFVIEYFKKAQPTKIRPGREIFKIGKYGFSQFGIDYCYARVPVWGRAGLLYTFKYERGEAIIITITRMKEKKVKLKK